MKSSKKHWEEVYHSIPTDKLGWYEESPKPSIDLFVECKLSHDSRILNVGAGTSTFIDYLVEEDYKQLLVADISESAINQLKSRLGGKAEQVEWIVDDLTGAEELDKIKQVDLWHDRAVLHFFTDETDQKAYFDLLKKLVKPGGFVIIAVFSLEGVKMCSGLPVKNYSTDMLQEKLGNNFKLIRNFNFLYTTPRGNPRDYIYTLFQNS